MEQCPAGRYSQARPTRRAADSPEPVEQCSAKRYSPTRSTRMTAKSPEPVEQLSAERYSPTRSRFQRLWAGTCAQRTTKISPIYVGNQANDGGGFNPDMTLDASLEAGWSGARYQGIQQSRIPPQRDNTNRGI